MDIKLLPVKPVENGRIAKVCIVEQQPIAIFDSSNEHTVHPLEADFVRIFFQHR